MHRRQTSGPSRTRPDQLHLCGCDCIPAGGTSAAIRRIRVRQAHRRVITERDGPVGPEAVGGAERRSRPAAFLRARLSSHRPRRRRGQPDPAALTAGVKASASVLNCEPRSGAGSSSVTSRWTVTRSCRTLPVSPGAKPAACEISPRRSPRRHVAPAPRESRGAVSHGYGPQLDLHGGAAGGAIGRRSCSLRSVFAEAEEVGEGRQLGRLGC